MEDLERIAPLFKAIIQAKGTPFVVGGFARDFFLGIDSKDIDIEVHGIELDELQGVLKSVCTSVDAVGKSFGVFKVRSNGLDLDISVPRTERKVGDRHTDFAVDVNPFIGIEKALARRDFTINAVAFEMSENGLIARIADPFDGVKDIMSRTIRMVGPAFGEDPLRVMRAVQFACRFGMQVESVTAAVCTQMVSTGELDHISKERIWTEWEKIGTKGQDFRALENAIEACGLQGRFGRILARRKVRLDGLEGAHRVAVVLASLNINVATLDVPVAIKTHITEIHGAIADAGGLQWSRWQARKFRRATWSDVLRIVPTLKVDPWVLEGPLPLPVTARDILRIHPNLKTGPWVGEMILHIEELVDENPMATDDQVWIMLHRFIANVVGDQVGQEIVGLGDAILGQV